MQLLLRYATDTLLSRAVPVFRDRCYNVKLAPASIKKCGTQEGSWGCHIEALCIPQHTHKHSEIHTNTQRQSKRTQPHWPEFKNQSPFTKTALLSVCRHAPELTPRAMWAQTHTLHQQDQTASPPIWEQAWEQAENILTISLCEFKSLFQAWLCSLIYSTSKRWLYNLINFSQAQSQIQYVVNTPCQTHICPIKRKSIHPHTFSVFNRYELIRYGLLP